MKNKIFALGGLVVLLGAGAGYSLHAQTPPAPLAGHGPRHPEIRRALKALNNAETDLQKAEHDFAGHREKALDMTQQAIKECQAALQVN